MRTAPHEDDCNFRIVDQVGKLGGATLGLKTVGLNYYMARNARQCSWSKVG